MLQLPSIILALVVTTLLVTPVSAQIAYLSLEGDGSGRLRRMNPDGSGDAIIPVPFANFGFPIWSRNGTRLALTASDPARPDQRGQNVFARNMANGSLQQLTFFNDLVTGDGTRIYSFPYYKAFSPDGSLLAVNSLVQYARDFGTSTTLPVLHVYSASVLGEPIQVHTDTGQNNKHHGGEGVDWSPVHNVLAAPLQASAPYQSGGGSGETTAIVLLEPVTGAVLQGRYRQLTHPFADGRSDLGLNSYLWGEHDYYPKFSPNGREVAFVRSFQNLYLFRSPTTPDFNIQSLWIVDVETGDEFFVIEFDPGFYVHTVDWSPDGTQLIFDISEQDSGPFGPLQRGRAETAQIYVINVDGTGLQQVRGSRNGSPSWSRTPNTSNPVIRILPGFTLTNGQFSLSGIGVPSQTHTVQATTNLLQPFVPIGTATADANGNFQFQDSTAANFSQRFYRITFP